MTIAALGDSLVQGYGLPDGEGLVPQLQQWLDAAGEDVVILNAGVSGDTTAGGLARINWTLSPDVDAVIVALGGNDVLRGIDPTNSRKNLDGILAIIAQKGLPVLLVRMNSPANYGADYKAEFDAIYPDLAQEHGTLLFPAFLSVLTDGRPLAEVLQTLMQQDGLHPNKSGVAVVVSAFGPAVQQLILRTKQISD